MKKKINIALIVVIVFVYGGIVYKFFGNKTVPEQLKTTSYTEGSLRLPESTGTKEDVFILSFSKRDPFLDKNYIVKKEFPRSQKSGIKAKTKTNPVLFWPTINYLGFSKSNHQAKKTAILRINGKLYRKREGSTIDHIKILKVLGDSIHIMFNKKEKKYFHKNAEQ